MNNDDCAHAETASAFLGTDVCMSRFCVYRETCVACGAARLRITGLSPRALHEYEYFVTAWDKPPQEGDADGKAI